MLSMGVIILSATFWNIRRKKRAELANKKEVKQEPAVKEVPKKKEKAKRGGKV